MGAFKEGVKKLEKKGESKREASAVMAIAGRKKYGDKAYNKKIAAGKKRAKRGK